MAPFLEENGRSMALLNFVSANGGSSFMQELLEVVAQAATEAGGSVAMHSGPLPPLDSESIYVVVPHEYFVLTPPHEHPTPAQMKRTIGLCVEHPGTATFETSAQWAARLGWAVDINQDSTDELKRRGVPASRFVLGYSQLWDTWHGDTSTARDIDITYLGTTDPRRDLLLALQSDVLASWRTSLLIPPHEQMTEPRPDFLLGAQKHAHLAASRILINLHRGSSRSLEWVRVLEAMCNGCVVVSETSTDFEPFVHGTHLAFASGEEVVDVASALLRHPERLDAIRDAAYSICRERLSMHDSAEALIEGAEQLKAGTNPRRTHAAAGVAPRMDSVPVMAEPLPPERGMPRMSQWAHDLPAEVRGALAENSSRTFETCPVAIAEVLTSAATPEGGLDVMVAANGDPADLATTLQSIAAQDVPARVLVASVESESPELGYPRARMLNALIEQTAADLLLVVDPGQELLPGAIGKLVGAMNANPAISAAYPMVADPRRGKLWNSLPPEAARLEGRVYLAAPMVIRREALAAVGGWAADAALQGYEDHELWRRLLGRGHAGMLVAEILAQGARLEAPTISLPRLKPELTMSRLSQSAGTLTRRQPENVERFVKFLEARLEDRIHCADLADPADEPGSARPTGNLVISGAGDSMPDFTRLLSSRGLAAELVGYSSTSPSRRRQAMVAVIPAAGTAPPAKAPPHFHVAAVMATFNEVDIVTSTIDRLTSQEIEVFVIDNWSTDGTYEVIWNRYRGSKLVHLERYPHSGASDIFNLRALLERTEEIGLKSGADWVIRNDADEVRESPWPGLTLRDALFTAQTRGYDCVDHTVLEFRPTPMDDTTVDDPVERLGHCEFGREEGHFIQINAWRNLGQRVQLSSTGGHETDFENQRVFPYKFLLRHYPIRSQAQGERKVFVDRGLRWDPVERALGWHTHYDSFGPGTSFLWNPSELIRFDADFAADYLIERISGVGLARTAR
jgi:hypothetical protein